MVSKNEAAMLQFISQIPPNVNPYLAVAAHLKQSIQPPTLAEWARIVLFVTIAGHALIFFQSLHLLWYRVRLNSFRLVTVTALGLYLANMPSFTVLIYFFYSPLSITDFCFQLAIEAGHRTMHNKMQLFCCKFLIILSGSWLYFWVITCQFMAAVWDVNWTEALRLGPIRRLPRWAPWVLHSFILIAIIWPIAPLVCFSIRFDRTYAELFQTAENIFASLKGRASTYNPKTFRTSDLLVLLLPARQLEDYESHMVQTLRTILWLGLTSMLMLCVMFVPLQTVSLRALKKRHGQCTFAETTCSAKASIQFARIRQKLEIERRTLVWHAVAVYLTNFAFIPPISFQLAIGHGDFLRSRRWHTITQLGMHTPFAIGANVILAILISQSRRWLVLKEVEAVSDSDVAEKGTINTDVAGISSQTDGQGFMKLKKIATGNIKIQMTM